MWYLWIGIGTAVGETIRQIVTGQTPSNAEIHIVEFLFTIVAWPYIWGKKFGFF